MTAPSGGGQARTPPCESQGTKKNSPETDVSELVSRTEILVRLAGIEPTTPWFVAKYSIQLSYSREALHYSTFIDAEPNSTINFWFDGGACAKAPR
jgi:hypothetical protein